MLKREMRCAINPAVGDERFINFEKADESYTVAIVGGGPAGLEAARIAALRGHKPTIFEKTGELGGAILLCCSVPGFSKMKWYADWIRRQIAKLKVEVKLRTEPSVTDLKDFDIVLLANGAVIERPDIPGINESLVLGFDEVLRCKSKNCEYYPSGREAPAECGDTVLVWGDYFGAINSVERLALSGKKVYLVTPNNEFAEWYDPVHRDVMLKRFNGGNGEGLVKDKAFKHPVTILVKSTVTEIKADGKVTIIDSNFNKQIIDVDNVVLANAISDDSFYEKCKSDGLVVQKIGDQNLVKNLRHAVFEGANAAFELNTGTRLNANGAVISNLPTEQVE
jgi:thioredoxin reductase